MIEGVCHCGEVRWRFEGVPATATICNCSLCRRTGALWAYGAEGDGIEVSGPTQIYVWGPRLLEFHFCAQCFGLAWWRTAAPEPDGRHFIGVNVRMAPPEAVQAIPLVRHDTETRTDLPPDRRCVADVWF